MNISTYTQYGYCWAMKAPDGSMIVIISINPATKR